MIIPVIVGPTGIGKTSLSIELAKKISGEIISADSMQVYEGMDIGTGKVTKEEAQGIPHHIIDIRKVYERYTVADFKKDALEKIEEIISRGNPPIIVGGTGLYINSLIYDYSFAYNDNSNYNNEKNDKNDIGSDNYKEEVYKKEKENQIEIEKSEKYVLEFRQKLEEKLKKGEITLDELYDKAYSIDLEEAKKISRNDKKRILRILELDYLGLKKARSENVSNLSYENNIDKDCNDCNHFNNYTYKVFRLFEDRKVLYEKIEKRIDKMLDDGLIEETKKIAEEIIEHEGFDSINDLTKENLSEHNITSLQAIGYKEPLEYLKGNISYDEMVYILKRDTRHYAKRQETWFRKIDTIDLDKSLSEEELVNIIMENI